MQCSNQKITRRPSWCRAEPPWPLSTSLYPNPYSLSGYLHIDCTHNLMLKTCDTQHATDFQRQKCIDAHHHAIVGVVSQREQHEHSVPEEFCCWILVPAAKFKSRMGIQRESPLNNCRWSKFICVHLYIEAAGQVCKFGNYWILKMANCRGGNIDDWLWYLGKRKGG